LDGFRGISFETGPYPVKNLVVGKDSLEDLWRGPPIPFECENSALRKKCQLGGPGVEGSALENLLPVSYIRGVPDPVLGTAVLLLNLLATAAWFVVLLALDPNRRVKKTSRALLECYLLGLSSVALTFFLYRLVDLPLLPAYRSGNTDSFFFWLEDVLSTGVVEELAKFLVFYAITRALRSLKEPLDGVLQAAAVALAFASVENLMYGFRFGTVRVVLWRSLIATTGHMSYAAVWGLFTACLRFGHLKVGSRDGWKVLALAVLGAAILHAAYNALLDLELTPLAVGLDALSLLVAILFLRSLARQPLYGAEPVSEPEKTLQLLHRSWRAGGDTPALHFRLGLAYLSLGDTTSALRHLERCRALRPGHPQVEALDGCARILSGRVDQGERLLAEAYARLAPRERWYLRRTVGRLLERREPDPGSPERAHRFHLRHFFLHARPRF
jgi:RsiW-degrading membrane proteinase PrsW (M82 family)